MASYDVKALFTSVPIDPSINIIKHKLQQDPLIFQRTIMSISQIVSPLEFCLQNTYFLFQDKYYEQVHGTAMGSTISPLIAACSWKHLKSRLLALPHPHLWLRVLDDTLIIQQAKHSNYSNTSTHRIHTYSSSQKTLTKKVPNLS